MLKDFLNYTLAFVMWLAIGRALLSLFTTDLKNPFYAFFYRFTEPLYRPLRRIVPFGHTIIIVLAILVLRILIVKHL